MTDFGVGDIAPASEGKAAAAPGSCAFATTGSVRDLVDGVDAILWEADWPSWQYTFVSQRAETILGYPRERWLAESHFWMNHLHPEDRNRAIAHSFGHTERGADHTHEFRMLSADDSEVWVRETVRIIKDETGRCCKLRGTMIDITDRKTSEQALRLSERRFRALYDEQPLMLFSLSPLGVIESVNDFGAQQLGYNVHELIGVSISDLHPANEVRQLRTRLARCLKGPDTIERWQGCLMSRDGKPMWVRVSGRAVRGAHERVTLLVLCEDVSEARERSLELAHRSSHDPLTGLLNRAWFERRLQRVLYAAYEYATEHVLGVLDVNQFKVLNHRFGHAAGDEFLRALSEIICDCARPTDTVGRVGGDEFGVLLENCSLERARDVASELMTAISAHDFEWGDESIQLSVSIGLVPVRASSDSVAELMSTAETACRAAGERGRSRIHVYHADDREVADRHREMEWAAQLQTALRDDRFELHFQPITPLAGVAGTKRRYELLVRMQAEDGTLVQPNEFMPAAERYQLLGELDRWVVAHALEWLAARPAEHVANEMCCINLSGPSLADRDFLTFALEKLSGPRATAQSVCFEITETSLIGNLDRAMHCVRALRRAGCRFALDDFGSGVSSFAYLRRLPVDYVKIDGIFVRNIAEDAEDLRFLRLINEIGHVTGKKTVAEFVENDAILQRLREIGVDYAQGFHIAPPRPISIYRPGEARVVADVPNVAIFAHERRSRPVHRA